MLLCLMGPMGCMCTFTSYHVITFVSLSKLDIADAAVN